MNGQWRVCELPCYATWGGPYCAHIVLWSGAYGHFHSYPRAPTGPTLSLLIHKLWTLKMWYPWTNSHLCLNGVQPWDKWHNNSHSVSTQFMLTWITRLILENASANYLQEMCTSKCCYYFFLLSWCIYRPAGASSILATCDIYNINDCSLSQWPVSS